MWVNLLDKVGCLSKMRLLISLNIEQLVILRMDSPFLEVKVGYIGNTPLMLMAWNYRPSLEEICEGRAVRAKHKANASIPKMNL